MKFLKINNLINQFGQCDYKGLNLDKFIPGSQIYSVDNSYCLLATNEDITSLPTDVEELLEIDYTNLRQEIETTQQQMKLSIEERTTLLEQAMNDMLLGGV